MQIEITRRKNLVCTMIALVLLACLTGCKPAKVAVPNVVGMTQAAAQSAITAANLTVGAITHQNNATVPSGSVCAQDPLAGASVSSGAAVALVISDGPALITVPDVVGMTQSAAASALVGAGLTVGDVTQHFSASVLAGQVISQDPSAGESVASGATVNLVVSEGPQGQGNLVGWVKSVAGGAIADVNVTLADGTSTTTDWKGHYEIDNVPEDTGVVITFEKAGFTTTSISVDIPASATATANASLAPFAQPVTASASGVIDLSDVTGNRITIPDGSLIDARKAVVTGDVQVQVTPLNIRDPKSLAAFPGSFVGQPLGAKAGETVRIETFALADFRVTQNGEVLNIGPDKAPATIQLSLPGDTKLQDGDHVPLWSFDE
ncbi:MAG: PASTA domain-containing protein, partial [Candidatus Hydrogenedentes bacterium]|nr:PASTA domain-containing protein [Candidatus Hydrogenedentota bacterium]